MRAVTAGKQVGGPVSRMTEAKESGEPGADLELSSSHGDVSGAQAFTSHWTGSWLPLLDEAAVTTGF